MKIIITQEEMKAIIEDALKRKFSLLVGSGLVVSEIKNIGDFYRDVEIILTEKAEAEKESE